MLYTRRPQEQLARLGLRPEDYDQDVHVWPENWPVLSLLQALDTQWDIVLGERGPVYVKLDYTALPVVAGGHGIPLDESFLGLLRHAERTARTCLNS